MSKQPRLKVCVFHNRAEHEKTLPKYKVTTKKTFLHHQGSDMCPASQNVIFHPSFLV